MAGSFGYEKNIMKSVCKWVKIPYFLKLELLIHNSYCSSWHELSPPDFDGTNRKALHPVSILRSCLKK
jgi:hypothetical protein